MRVTRIAQDGDGVFAEEVSPGEYRFLSTSFEGAVQAAGTGSPARGDTVTGKLLPPVTPGKIVAIGLNYMDHINESGSPKPDRPLIFSKFPSSMITEGDAIEVDVELTRRVDWEVELAVVIGRPTRRVRAEDALSSVFGYAVANDVSARDVQFADGQWVRGKNLDTFLPIGPAVVTPDELADPSDLQLGTRVNGVPMQASSTSLMLFSVPELISFCSWNFTLDPGDVILTGTPWGCGEFMDPPVSLSDGDIVEVWVEGIGVMTNPVRFI